MRAEDVAGFIEGLSNSQIEDILKKRGETRLMQLKDCCDEITKSRDICMAIGVDYSNYTKGNNYTKLCCAALFMDSSQELVEHYIQEVKQENLNQQ